MIYLNVMLTVREAADVVRVQGFLAEMARRSQAEPGCERFEVYRSQSNDRVFLLVEWWRDAGALEAHRTADSFVNFYTPNVLPLVEREPHPSDRIA